MSQTNHTILTEILEKIKAYDKIIIHRHINPDPDAIGSQVGLAEIIRHNFPNKTVLTAGEGVEDLNFLSSFDGVPESAYPGSLVIVTDTANIGRIDGQENYDRGDFLIKIDHHPKDDSYGDIEWVDTHASSCSEMIGEFLLHFKDQLSLSDNGARLLYGGIVGDTGRFQYPATTPKTLRIAAELMEYDFDHSDLLNQLYEMKAGVAKLMGYVLDNLEVDSGVGSVVIKQALLKQLGIQDSQTNAIVGVLSSIQGVECWGIFVEQEEGFYRCRLRSKKPVINTIAREHDGGGHPLASGANAKDLEEVNEIIQKLKQVTADYREN